MTSQNDKNVDATKNAQELLDSINEGDAPTDVSGAVRAALADIPRQMEQAQRDILAELNK